MLSSVTTKKYRLDFYVEVSRAIEYFHLHKNILKQIQNNPQFIELLIPSANSTSFSAIACYKPEDVSDIEHAQNMLENGYMEKTDTSWNLVKLSLLKNYFYFEVKKPQSRL